MREPTEKSGNGVLCIGGGTRFRACERRCLVFENEYVLVARIARPHETEVKMQQIIGFDCMEGACQRVRNSQPAGDDKTVLLTKV